MRFEGISDDEAGLGRRSPDRPSLATGTCKTIWKPTGAHRVAKRAVDHGHGVTRSRRKPPPRRCRPTSSLGRSDRPLALLLSSLIACSETLLSRFFVASQPVPDLLLCAKHLFVAAMVWVLGHACSSRMRCRGIAATPAALRAMACADGWHVRAGRRTHVPTFFLFWRHGCSAAAKFACLQRQKPAMFAQKPLCVYRHFTGAVCTTSSDGRFALFSAPSTAAFSVASRLSNSSDILLCASSEPPPAVRRLLGAPGSKF